MKIGRKRYKTGFKRTGVWRYLRNETEIKPGMNSLARPRMVILSKTYNSKLNLSLLKLPLS